MKNFPNSLQFRIPAVFIVSFLFILAAIFVVFSTVGKNLLEIQSYKGVILSGQNIVSELGNRIALAESLAEKVRYYMRLRISNCNLTRYVYRMLYGEPIWNFQDRYESSNRELSGMTGLDLSVYGYPG